MGNQMSTQTVHGAAVYNKKQDVASVRSDSNANDRPNSYKSVGTMTSDEEQDRPNSYKSVGTMTSDEEQVTSVSRSTTYVLEQREATGSSGYASMGYRVRSMSDTNKEMKEATGSIDGSTRKGLNTSDETRLRRSIRFIKDEIEPDLIVDCLIRDGFLSEDDRERIKQAGTRRDQVHALLCMLERMQEEAFGKFLDYLVETGYGYVKENILGMSDNYEIEETTWKVSATAILQNKTTLVNQLEPDAIFEYMVEYGVISFEEYSMHTNKSLHRPEKAEILIDLILAYQPKSFNVFIHALQETKCDYCIHVLKNTQTNFETVAATASSEKIKVLTVAQGASKKLLKGVDKVELKLEFRNNGVGLEIVEELNSCCVKLNINDELFEKQLVYTSSERGSIIIRLRALRQDKRHDIEEEFKVSTILEVLNVFVKHSPGLRRFCGQVFDVKLEVTHAIGRKTTKTKLLVDEKTMIQKNMALLEEELDALSLTKDLELDGVFTKEEVTEILRIGNPRRKERTKRMLLKLLEKDHNDIGHFIRALKRKKKDLVVNHLLEKEGVSLHETGMFEAKNISQMIIDMSPVLIEKDCAAMDIVAVNDDKIIQSREAHVKSFLLNLATKTDEEIISTVQVLQFYQHIPRDIVGCKPQQEGERRIKPISLHIGEFKIEKEQDVIQRKPNAKGTHSQYLKPHRIPKFSLRSESSCSNIESGNTWPMFLDSIEHDQRTPRIGVSPRLPDLDRFNTTTRSYSTVMRPLHAKRLKANTSFSLKSLNNLQVLPALTSPNAVALKSGDVTIDQEKITKRHQSQRLKQLAVTPISQEDKDFTLSLKIIKIKSLCN